MAEYRDPVSALRHLKDSLANMRKSLNTLVFLSVGRPLPSGLASDIGVLEWPLPDREDLGRALGRIAAVLESRGVPVRLPEDGRRRLVEAGLGLTGNPFEDALATEVVRTGRLDAAVDGHLLAAKAEALLGAGGLEAVEASTSLDEVRGLAEFKRWLVRRAVAFSGKAAEAGIEPPKGVLLLGVQGCGKSLAAKACGSTFGFPVVRLDVGALYSAEIGSSEARIREALRRVEAMSPCVLWLDEMEKAASGMGGSGRSDAGTSARVFAALATGLQERTRPVFVAATANGVAELPPEMLRKGRWDEIFFVDLPGPEAREELFAIHLGRRGFDPSGFNTALLAGASSGFSGAEIAQVVSEARLEAFCRERPLAVEGLLAAIRVPGPWSWPCGGPSKTAPLPLKWEPEISTADEGGEACP